MPNPLMERTEVEELIIGFDINQFITPEEDGDLSEICVQQGIDASAKKSPSRPKGGKRIKKSPMSRGAQLRKKHGSSTQGYESRIRKFTGKDNKKHKDAVKRIVRQEGASSGSLSSTKKSIARHQRKQVKKNRASLSKETLRALDDF